MSDDSSRIYPEDRISVSVVPWYNADEFHKVHEYLYSEDINQKRWAYDTISIWETRCYPTLPAAIEASYLLTSAVIQDILWTNEASLNQHTDIQGLYGSAITRFVSLIVEVNQDYTINLSAAHVAKRIGIPSYIVELRNEFCHSQRPSLSLLRRAAVDALSYLKTNFWEVESSKLRNHKKRPRNDDANIEAVLHDYIAVKLNVLSQARYGSTKNYDDESKLPPILSRIGYLIRKNQQLFIQTLISDGIFIPDVEDFKRMVPSKLFKDFLYEEAVSDEDCLTSDSILTFKHLLPELPDIHLKLWEPVIHELNRCQAVPAFMEALLRSQGDRTVVGQKLIIVWVRKIWAINFYRESVGACSLRRVFSKNGIVVNWRRLFHSAIVNPCKYTLAIIPQLMAQLDWKNELKFHMVNMLAIYLGQVQKGFIKPPPNLKPKLFTVEDFKLSKRLQKEKEASSAGKSFVSVCSDESYKSWPVGAILNTIIANQQSEEESDNEFENFDDEIEGDGECLSSNKNDNEDAARKIDKPYRTFPNFDQIRKVFQMRNWPSYYKA